MTPSQDNVMNKLLTRRACAPTAPRHAPGKPCKEQGVVLVIALILLVVMSLLAVTSMRSAASSETISGSVRTTELATQAAEIALRHCEASATKVSRVLGGDTTSAEATYSTTLVEANILRATTSVAWQSTATWDSASTATYVLPLSLVNQSGMTMTTYKRAPECMVESLTGTAPVAGTASYVITARGFGPEVPALAVATTRVRPVGTEVWLQSTIELQ